MHRIVSASFLGVFIAVVWLVTMAGKAAPIEVGADRMKLHVLAKPRIWMRGDLYVECRVPRVAEHEWVSWGVDCPTFFRASTEAAGRVLYSMFVTLPATTCGACAAFCEVALADRLGTVRAMPATIVTKGIGCPEEEP
jgi:hypothetical protein